MKCYIGIDLGSTTTKAIVLDEAGDILGRGITNSRSNYDVACEVARGEAIVDAHFQLFRRAAHAEPALAEAVLKSMTTSTLLRNSSTSDVMQIPDAVRPVSSPMSRPINSLPSRSIAAARLAFGSPFRTEAMLCPMRPAAPCIAMRTMGTEWQMR